MPFTVVKAELDHYASGLDREIALDLRGALGGEAFNPRVHLLMHQAVAERLMRDDPPEDWLVFEALLARGVDAHEAQHAMGRRLFEEVVAELGPPPAPAPLAPRPQAGGDRRARDRRKAQRAARRRSRR